MMLIEHEARVGLPRMWEHPRRTRTRRGGVVASMVGGIYADMRHIMREAEMSIK